MKLNNKTLLCKLGTIVLLIGAAGCGKSADTVPVDENAASTAEETVIEDTEPVLSDAPSEEKEVSSSALPSTITINGMEITYPLSRQEFEAFGTANELTEEKNTRFEIRCAPDGQSSSIHAKFLTADEDFCTSIVTYELPSPTLRRKGFLLCRCAA